MTGVYIWETFQVKYVLHLQFDQHINDSKEQPLKKWTPAKTHQLTDNKRPLFWNLVHSILYVQLTIVFFFTWDKNVYQFKDLEILSVFNASIWIIAMSPLTLLVHVAKDAAMISFWKFDLVHSFTNRHPKYLILAHRLLAFINGCLPEKLDLI